MGRPRDIGTAAETAVVRALRARGFPQAERRSLKGVLDEGDITGTPGLCWEVKGGDAARNASDGQISAWLAETETERLNARADVGILVVQRRRIGARNAHRWWAIMRANAWILGGTKHDFPVRILLEDACTLLRKAGYGEPLDKATS
jgi:hypothetical protein